MLDKQAASTIPRWPRLRRPSRRNTLFPRRAAAALFGWRFGLGVSFIQICFSGGFCCREWPQSLELTTELRSLVGLAALGSGAFSNMALPKHLPVWRINVYWMVQGAIWVIIFKIWTWGTGIQLSFLELLKLFVGFAHIKAQVLVLIRAEAA